VTQLSRKQREIITGYGLIAPNLLGTLIFWTIPVIFAVVIAFTEWDFIYGLQGIKFIGVEHFVKMWNDEWFLVSLKNNLIFLITTVPVSIAMTLVLIVFIKDCLLVGKKYIKAALYIPRITSVVAIAVVWHAMMSKYGPVMSLIRSLGFENPPVFLADSKYALFVVIFIQIWSWLGYGTLIYLSGLLNIPKELYESSEIDGASSWQKFTKITIPMVSSTTFFLLITKIFESFKVFGLINALTEGGPGNSTTVLVYNIYRTAFRFYKMGYASAMGVVMLIIVMIITLIQWHYQRKFTDFIN
jgi:multiple sugar transport system permease protein